ncbi:MAG: prepilin-type N-terminal cleavage/methylation domain-containing protein [Gammaproteobacteria bacterium]|nr:prepilin-type N-terminal cleavage/methylation domain-containing protein [Gammaproteobacteria bacterium]
MFAGRNVARGELVSGIPPRRCGGFTLIEVVVSLGIASVIGLLLFNTLGFSNQVVARIDEQESVSGGGVDMQSRMLRFVELARPVKLYEDGKEIAFEGHRDRLRFVSDISSNDKHIGLHIFTLDVERIDRKDALVLHVGPYSREAWLADDTRKTTSAVITRDVEDASFDYFHRDGGRLSEWLPEWGDETAMPELIRVNIRGKVSISATKILIGAPRIGGYYAPEI